VKEKINKLKLKKTVLKWLKYDEKQPYGEMDSLPHNVKVGLGNDPAISTGVFVKLITFLQHFFDDTELTFDMNTSKSIFL
jgi:hypothetical protein